MRKKFKKSKKVLEKFQKVLYTCKKSIMQS